ncbi:MAG: hypothetical protein ABI472_10635 [Ginsengibacter sp.]
MQQFEIVLKNYKIKSYRFIALLIVLSNMAVFIFLLFSDVHFFEAAASVFLVALYGLYRFYLVKKNKSEFYLDEICFFILAGCWVGLQNYLLSFSCILMGILYHLSLQKFQFVFNNDFVKKMNFPTSEYSWDNFNNVLLKDNILTLDFNNNKLIQVEIENEKSISEKDFNEFAGQQLFKYSHPEKTIFLN